jgi:hypothetical protein
MIDLAAIERDLTTAYSVRLALHRRRRRIVHSTLAIAAVACTFVTVAVASGIGPDLQLDPTQWIVLGSGSDSSGRGSYVHAKRISDGSHSTFMVEHGAGLSPYDAFLLHERTKSAADSTSPVPQVEEPGPLCTADQLTRAEKVALQALTAVAPGTPPNATKQLVDDALGKEFASSPCRGLEYGGEQARFVWAGIEPRALLMPRAR